MTNLPESSKTHDQDGRPWLERIWKSPQTGWMLFASCAYGELRFWLHTPSPGKAIGLLAVAAALMAIRRLGLLAELLWCALLGSLLLIEFRSIDQDRIAAENKSTAESMEQRQRDASQRLEEQAQFKRVLSQNQEDLSITLGKMSSIGNSTQQTELLTRQSRLISDQQLCKREESFSKSLRQDASNYKFEMAQLMKAAIRERKIPSNGVGVIPLGTPEQIRLDEVSQFYEKQFNDKQQPIAIEMYALFNGRISNAPKPSEYAKALLERQLPAPMQLEPDLADYFDQLRKALCK